jgi:general secretion pathway protein L
VNDALILFLSAEQDGAIAWVRVADGGIIGTGDVFAGDTGESDVIAVLPAAHAGIDWIMLPEMPQAQRDAAARELLATQLIDNGQTLHLVTGRADEETDLRPVAWVDEQHVETWLAELLSLGVVPIAMIPAQLAVHAPDDGFVVAQIGPENIVRGVHSAWLSDPALNGALMEQGTPISISERQRDAGLLRMVETLPLNMIAGRFAPRSNWSFGVGQGQWLFAFAAALALVTLLIPIAVNWQINSAAARIEAEAAQVATQMFPASSDPAAQLTAAVTAKRGGGAGFLPTLSAVSAAVSSTANVELTGLRFSADGTLETTVRATNAAEAAEVRSKIEARGFEVETGAETTNQGRLLQTIRVRGS